MATNPWERDWGNGPTTGSVPPAPQTPGVIYGRPKMPTRFEVEDQEIQRAKAARDVEADALKNERDRLSIEKDRRELARGEEANAIEAERKAAAFLIRGLGANEAYEGSGVGPRSYVGQKLADNAPDILNSLPGAIGNSPERQVSDSAQDEFIAASLRQDSGAAIPPEELERQRRIYFPMPGEGPEAIEHKRQARLRALEGLKQSAGRLEASAEDRYNRLMANRAGPSATADDQSTRDPNAPPGFNFTDDNGNGVYDGDGNPLGPDGGLGFDAQGNQLGLFGGRTTDTSPTDYDREVEARARFLNEKMGDPSLGDLVKQGQSGGLRDQAAGVGGAIAGLLQGDFDVVGNYQLDRDAEKLRYDQARERYGAWGTAAEVLGSFGSLGTGLASTALTLPQAIRQGATVGAVGGYGYGDGLVGSIVNAGGGAVAGGLLGGGAQIGGNALTGLATRNASRAAERGQRAVDLSRAGQAEGVTVNRAMVDLGLENRVTGVDATMTGGPRLQREMGEIEDQIAGRVANLGQGGRPMNGVVGGQTIERAGRRAIEQTGRAANRKYTRAERLAGDARVTPDESLRRVDEMIATLSETPGQNSAEIAFLNTLKSDLSQNLSVGALRRMRTSLRKRISNGGLTFGEDEARVLGIMDAAADDIRAGLTAQGNQAAADAFDAADKSYRARMDYINGTLQRVLSKRNSNQSAEQVWRKFEAMASNRGDAVGLRKFYASLTPEERLDVAATFADDLGRNNAGDFSVAHFLSQTEKLSDDAIVTIFGKEGAESIANLRMLGKEVKRVTGAMNSRKSGTGVANNYRDWLNNLLLGALAGGGSGVAAGSTGAMAGAGAALGTNAVRNVLSARSLTSPNLTKWIAQAPRTGSPRAIQRHFDRLGDIAKAEPALAGEIQFLRDAIMKAANDNAGVARSVAEQPEE